MNLLKCINESSDEAVVKRHCWGFEVETPPCKHLVWCVGCLDGIKKGSIYAYYDSEGEKIKAKNISKEYIWANSDYTVLATDKTVQNTFNSGGFHPRCAKSTYDCP